MDEVILFYLCILSEETDRPAKKKTDREREVGINRCTTILYHSALYQKL